MQIRQAVLNSAVLMASAMPSAHANAQYSLEIGSGAVFVYPHPQLRLGLLLPDQWLGLELQLLGAVGVNNFDHWAYTGGITARYFVPTPWEHRPYVRAGLVGAWTPETENRSPLAGWIDIGAEGPIWGPLRYSAGVAFLGPDIYSRSPFVFRPELNLRTVF